MDVGVVDVEAVGVVDAVEVTSCQSHKRGYLLVVAVVEGGVETASAGDAEPGRVTHVE